MFCETYEVFIVDKLIDAVDDVNFLHHFLLFFFESVRNLLFSLSLQNKNSVVTELNTPVDENSKLTVEGEILMVLRVEAGNNLC